MIRAGFLLFKKFANIAAKIFIVLAVFVTVINLFLILTRDSNSSQATPIDPIRQHREEIYKFINDPANSKSDKKMSAGLYRGFMCMVVGEACTDNPDDGDKNYDSSVLGSLSNLIVAPYMNPPSSGVMYAYETFKEAGFMPKAYAAEGIGFASIRGYMKLWSLFRNLTYLLLVLVIITIGFMIMFRMKLNPQTVISIENSLPRIVLALILITFSFAIAGLLIDLMYIIIGLSIYTFSQLNIGILTPSNMANLQNEYIGAGVGRIWPQNGVGTAMATGQAFFNILPTIVKGPIRLLGGFIVGMSLARLLLAWSPLGRIKSGIEGAGITIASFGFTSGKISNWLTLPLEYLLFAILFNFLPGFIIGLGVTITIVFLVFRIFFLLLTSYIKIILFIIFAPILLIFEAIPGRNTFSFWLKSLIGELIAFPLVMIVSLAGYAMVTINLTEQAFVLPFLHGYSNQEFGVLIGLGIILTIPQLVKLVKGAMGLKDLPFNIGVGTFFGGVTTTVGGALGLVTQYSALAYHMPGLKSIGYKHFPRAFKTVFGELPTLAGTDADAKKDDEITTSTQAPSSGEHK